MKSFWLELIAIDVLAWWQYRMNSTTYYDWMVVSVMGELMWIGDSWKSKAESARGRAELACNNPRTVCSPQINSP
jgi:hypothetical protein